MADCINCKKCDGCRKEVSKTQSRVKDIKHILTDIKQMLGTNNNMNSGNEIEQLKEQVKFYAINYERAKTEAETWKEAFNALASGKFVKRERMSFGEVVKPKKTTVENFQEGEIQAEVFLSTNNIQDVEQRLAEVEDGSVVGVKNVFLAGIATGLRERVVETIVGYLTKLIKENAVKVADGLLAQTEDRIIDGYMRLNDEDKFLLKNELKKYPRFTGLLEKIEKE